MGLSTSLLIVAALAALVPVALVGATPPRSIQDLEKVLVSGFVIVVVGAVMVNGIHGLDFFGILHLLYLLGVVSLPLILGAWFLLSLRGERRRIDTVFGVTAAVVALLGLYATHIEPGWLRVDEVVVEAAVPRPLRIGVLADLQTPNVGAHEQRAVDLLLERQPDLIVVPGDLYQGEIAEITANRGDFVALLEQLVASTAAVAVTSGDSDHGIPLEPIVTEAGALFIDDTITTIDIDGQAVRIAGVRVLANGPARAATFAALTEPTDALSLLIAHRPDAVYELAPGSDVDLIISGHTHGGQIAIPFFGPPVTLSGVPRDIAGGGLGLVDNVPLYVSAGVGLERLSAPQVRFGVRPEVGIVDILPR